MSDDDLTPAERAEIERVRGVLADAAVWAEPPLDLQERVVAAIAEEAGAGRRLRRIRYSLMAVAAAVVLLAGVTIGLQVTRDEPVQYAASLTGTRLAPDAAGERHADQDRQRMEDRTACHRTPATHRRRVLRGVAEERRGPSCSDRHVQRGHRRHSLVRRRPEHVSNADRHQGGRRRQPGVIGPSRPHRSSQRVLISARSWCRPPAARDGSDRDLRHHRDFVQDGRPIWHYNQTPGEYDGAFNSTLTFSGPFGSYTKEQWPAGSAYPDFFVIGDPHLNFYEGSATIDDLRMYVPSS